MASIKLKGDTSGDLTIQAPSVAGTNTLNLPASSGTLATTAQASIGTKNLIINGNMQIAQRGTSFANANGYTLDRWRYVRNTSGVVTVTQDTDTPSGQGFSKSLKIAVTTADTSIGASEYGLLTYFMEGQNLQHLKYGTSNAEKITLSFWVKSNKTGTYCVAAQKLDTTRYDYVTEYTINSANTWEKKTITIAPDSNIQASGGVIDDDNGIGLSLVFALADGTDRQGTNETWNTSVPATSTSNQVNFLDSTSNYINITAVQLEVGENATPFENRMYSQELAMCQRYCYVDTGANCFVAGAAGTSTNMFIKYVLPSPMRATPTLSFISLVASQIVMSDQYSADFAALTPTILTAPAVANHSGRVQIGGFTGLTVGRWYGGSASTTGKSIFSAEL